MRSHRLQIALSTLILMALLRPGALAQVAPPQFGARVGIITDRLSSKQIKRWEAILRVALARGPDDRPLHPTLCRLLEWAMNSGHAIYIELPDPDGYQRSVAGRFRIQWCDPTGKRHIAVIRLYLANIDQAHVGPNVMRRDGLIPLQGLTKEERYAEVLGHELAHAYQILTDLQLAISIEDLVERTNALLLSQNASRGTRELEPGLRWRLYLRDLLLMKVEAYAEAIESEIWRELTASKNHRQATGK